MRSRAERHFNQRSRQRNTRSMPFRRVHKHLPHWVKVLLNFWMRRYGDPGDRV